MNNKQPNPFGLEDMTHPLALMFLARCGLTPNDPTEKFCSAIPWGVFRRDKNGKKAKEPTYVPLSELSTTQLKFLLLDYPVNPIMKAVILEILKGRWTNGEVDDEMEDGVDSLFANCEDDDCDSCQGRA